MSASEKRASWGISIVCHVAFIALASCAMPTTTMETKTEAMPITVQLIEKKIEKKAASKELVSKKASTKAKKKPKPTSLPGDRVRPAIAKQALPVYPKDALNNDWEGTVKVKVMVSKKGTVTGVTVLSSSGHDALDQAFIRSIRQHYRFKPKRSMGKNTSGAVILSHTFSLGASR